MQNYSRRNFLSTVFGMGAAASMVSPFKAFAAAKPGSKMRFGLVTYLWGQHWDLPTLIANCEAAKVLGVELRTTHKHGVERELTVEQRKEVKKRFDDSPVVHVGIGSNERFDHTDPEALKEAIQATKDFIRLSHDCGGSGVKVKPNSLHKDVEPPEVTIERIGKALNEVAAYGLDYGQQIRLEVHGQCQELPIMKQIMDVADHPNVGVCWNSNAPDLEGEGLEHNFNLVKDRFGATAHVRELNSSNYPYQKLLNLYVGIDYDGWILLEASSEPEDKVAALAEQQKLFEEMVAEAQQALA
jgi:sugar phosphate isomerase/epimerase